MATRSTPTPAEQLAALQSLTVVATNALLELGMLGSIAEPARSGEIINPEFVTERLSRLLIDYGDHLNHLLPLVESLLRPKGAVMIPFLHGEEVRQSACRGARDYLADLTNCLGIDREQINELPLHSDQRINYWLEALETSGLRDLLTSEISSKLSRLSQRVREETEPSLTRLSHAQVSQAIPQREEVMARVMNLYTSNIADKRIHAVILVICNDSLTTNERLLEINGLIPIPADASARQLGAMLEVSKQAVMKTDWWMQNRKGKQDELVARRESKHHDARGGINEVQI